MSRATEEWVERAQYDLETAKTLLETGRYLYVLFCCQQAVEKAFKALIVNQTGEMPPRIHNLTKLMAAAGLKPDEERVDFLAALSVFYVQTRYPGEIELPATEKNRESAESVVRKTEDMVEWLFSMLK
jgi:HEPN domain-containing protein